MSISLTIYISADYRLPSAPKNSFSTYKSVVAHRSRPSDARITKQKYKTKHFLVSLSYSSDCTFMRMFQVSVNCESKISFCSIAVIFQAV